MFQNQDGSTTTFNEYDVESDEAFHSHNHKSQTTNVRTPILTNSTTNTKKITHHNRNSNRNSQSLSPRLDSPQWVYYTWSTDILLFLEESYKFDTSKALNTEKF